MVRAGGGPGGDADPGALPRVHRLLARLLARGRRVGGASARRHAGPAGPRALDQDGPPRGLHHRAAGGGPRRVHRGGGRRARSTCWATPWAAGLSWVSCWPGPTSCARSSSWTPAPGPSSPTTRTSARCARVHRWRSTRPAACRPRSSLGGPEDVLIERPHAGGVAEGEGRHLRRHGRLRRQGTRLGADGTEIPAGRRSLRSRLPSIACPTTVIVGEHDHPLVDQAPELAAEVADGRLTVIEGAYHSPQLTHRRRVAGGGRGPPGVGRRGGAPS